jgi:predicted glycosyltransferase
MNANTKWLTVNALSVLSHAERRLVARWMEIESVPCKRNGKRTVYDKRIALAAIRSHRKATQDESPPFEIDMRRLLATVEHQLALLRRHRKIIAVLCNGTDKLSRIIVSGELALTEAQAEKLVALVELPWTECKQLFTAEELGPEETESAT